MANCQELFMEFLDAIYIGSNKKSRMIASKEALRKRIRKWFKENHPEYEPKFFIQGSHKMKTGIRTDEDICDLDDGIYFFKQPNVTATTLQSWVLEAVAGYTETYPEHRKKCIRSIFAGDYEIDHPIYYKTPGSNYKIAVKNIGYEDSDPKALIEWFNNRKDKKGILVRMVMYLKAWCDEKSNMPSGLAMTILAANAKEKITLNDRDDITLRDILREIKKELNCEFKCIVPVVPYDNLFGDFDTNRKKNILFALENFIEDAERALKEENELKASKRWIKNLGCRFPEGEDKIQQSNSPLRNSVIIGASGSNPWSNE